MSVREELSFDDNVKFYLDALTKRCITPPISYGSEKPLTLETTTGR
jgi:hypothetical protein